MHYNRNLLVSKVNLKKSSRHCIEKNLETLSDNEVRHKTKGFLSLGYDD